MVMTELMASDGLFTASIVTAMEWVSMPTTALKAARRTFAPMPRTLVLTMVASRLRAPGSAPAAVATGAASFSPVGACV